MYLSTCFIMDIYASYITADNLQGHTYRIRPILTFVDKNRVLKISSVPESLLLFRHTTETLVN